MKSLTRTSKGEQTRERIFDTAIALFQTKGYETTTMRDIAAEAGCSLGLAYRYFDRKEDLVLALYRHLANELARQVEGLSAASVANRFEQTMRAKLALVTPYRDILGALFSAGIDPKSSLSVLGDNTADIRQQVINTYKTVISQATDAPKEPLASQLALMLYGTHLATLLFWMHDRSPNAQATGELIDLTRDGLALIRPMLGLPPISKLLTRLTKVIEPMLGSKT